MVLILDSVHLCVVLCNVLSFSSSLCTFWYFNFITLRLAIYFLFFLFLCYNILMPFHLAFCLLQELAVIKAISFYFLKIPCNRASHLEYCMSCIRKSFLIFIKR